MNRLVKAAILWFPILLPLYVLRFNIGPLPTTVLELAFGIVVLAATAVSGWNLWKSGFQRTRAWHLPAALWIIATFITVSVAPHLISALGLWRAYVLEPMVYALLLAAALDTKEDRATLLRAFILTSVLVTTIAVIQFATGKFIPHPWNTDLLTRRATGPFPFPNALSLFSAPIAALCFGKLIEDLSSHVPSKKNALYWVGFGSALLATLLAKSVGGFLGICAAIFVGLITWKKTRRGVLAAVALVIISIFAVPQLRTPVIKTLSFKQWSGQVRVTIWKETINMLKDRPLTGAGFGAYPDVIAPYHKATYIEIFQYPHDILLNLWSETGMLGILAFGWICWAWIRLSLQKEKQSGSAFSPTFYLLLPLAAILVQGLVDVPYFKNDLAFQFWMLAMLTV